LAAIAALFPVAEPGTPQEARARARTFTESAGLTAPGRDELAIHDRTVPGPAGAPDVTVRVYDPPLEGPRPAVVYIHGGAFIAGDLDIEDMRCVRLARDAGCVVVSVDYRLAPEERFPAALDDCYAALRWTASEAASLDIDAARLGIVGASAGGNLAAAVALLARDRGGPDLAFQMLLYPCLDDRMTSPSVQVAGTPMIDAASCAMAWSHYLDPNASTVPAYAAPARAIDLAGLPPAYVMVSELDPLRDECIEYATRLLQSGVPTELHVFAGAFHGFDMMPTTLSRRAADEQVEWLRHVTQPRPANVS
jgi:acetyl esterase/lipase